MKFTEGQVKDIVTLKESLIGEIDRHNESIEMLGKNITILDLFLKDSSFTRASQMEAKAEIQDKTDAEKPKASSIPIKRVGDGKVIANAHVTAEQISIVLDDEIMISEDTPPFKSFFLDRIIGEMKKVISQRQRMEKSKKSLLSIAL